MAEFNINRIRYTWRGTWNTSTEYNRDDVVRYGGSSWVCFRQHTASTFISDQNFLANPNDTDFTPAWRKMTGGRSFVGDWSQSTTYAEGDILAYGGNLYLVVTAYVSASIFENGLSNLALYTESISYEQDWTTNTRYAVNDLVKYGGIVYRCIEGHTSASTVSIGLEQDQARWEIFYLGVEYRGNWNTGSRYRLNDLVKFGGSIFRCKKHHTSGSDSTINFDQDEHWNIEFFGYQFRSDWQPSTLYQVGSIVRHGGYLYYSVSNNYNSIPTASIYQIEDRQDPIDWQIVSKGLNFRGTWTPNSSYLTGDVVRRGGNLYVALLDTALSADGSSLDYLDSSNWELVTATINWRSSWQDGIEYEINDVVIYFGNTYKCNFYHISSDENFPGDNGSGFFYWDLILIASSEAGLHQPGDLLTYDLKRSNVGDTSTFGLTGVALGDQDQLVSINDEDSVIYKTYRNINRVRYVSLEGVDEFDTQRGISPFKPWRTVRFAAEQVDDDFEGTTTIRVAPGKYDEVLPITVPARVAIVGAELRTTTINAAPAIENPALDSTITIAVLNRISALIQSIIAGQPLSLPKTPTNSLNPVVLTETVVSQISFDPPQFDPITFEEIFQITTSTQTLPTDPIAATDIQQLIQNIISYINFYVNSTGSNPTLIATNTAITNQGYLNTVLVLEANKEFLAAEAVAFLQVFFPSYQFVPSAFKRDVRRYIDAWKYDIIYTGNYKSLLAARYYRNAVLGSLGEDMFYLRDATGLRNCTLTGLTGFLNPPGIFDLYRLPTGGSFCSLDPGWGPDDDRTWILTRSPYIQNVSTFGIGCVGQKIDGALHNGGNRSIVSNDFTQVLSDGVGAWVTNNGRAELVSVFTYYCHVGYLAADGGIIRGANGNCSYGRFGAVADGVDLTEVPKTASINNRNNRAIVSAAFAGDFVDEIQILEWLNAGQEFTQASATFVGAGIDAAVKFEDFRDDAVFESRRIDTSTTITQSIGGGGYTIIQNNAQAGDATTITIATNDPNSQADYLGMRIIITSGPGTGQYGYITAYDNITKVVSVSRESDDQPGWDHVVPGKPVQIPLGTQTTYRIEPRPIFSTPEYTAIEFSVPVSTNWTSAVYGETTETYTNLLGQPGSGFVETQDGLEALTARFNISKIGRNYTVTINNAGAGYSIGDQITILGTNLGGATPINDLIITVTATSADSTNSITDFVSSGVGASGRFVILESSGSTGVYSSDGETWQDFTILPGSAGIGDWNNLATGNNRFIAIRRDSSVAASSLDGVTWTERIMPASRQWNAVVYGGDRFVAIAGNLNAAAYSLDGQTWIASTMPTIGDSTINEWVDIAYGKNKFVAIANSQNISAESPDGITWTGHTMDVISDSSQKDWVSVAYGNNRFVAISSTGDVAYSFDGIGWLPATMPTQDGSTAHYWRKIRYAQGVFFAVGDTGGRVVGNDPTTGSSTFAATSFDGIVWTNRQLASDLEWKTVAFGNPYLELFDSTVGKNTPMWIAVATGTDKINRIRTGARALGRVSVSAGVISEVKLWDTGSGYQDEPTLTVISPNKTSDIRVENRLADGVLTNPTWLNRGLGYRTATTRVSVDGNGFADIIPEGKFVTISKLISFPGPGAQIQFAGNDTRYTIVTIENKTLEVGGEGFSARLRVNPELKNRDRLEHETAAVIRELFSQIRITGHDFLDIGTGNFIETNYPDLYNVGFFTAAPENEVVEEDGGRVFYTSTDQSGNFRTGELFAVEQATGIVTISADFFNLEGLTELRLGGIRIGGTGAVIREFSTDSLLTEDSNNIVPTQRAIRAYLSNRLTVGGSEIAVGSFIAGTVLVGPDRINNVAGLRIVLPKRMEFDGPTSGISGSMLAQTMFFRSFGEE
jgi:hypothetical protein